MKPLYIVAVSGGVDSIVLLHMLVNTTSAKHLLQGEERFPGLIPENQAEGQASPRLIVAHIDHGIRTESAEDAAFVRTCTEMYKLPFEVTRLELGADASEERARGARWQFLRDMKRKHLADKIVTAHHADDVVETMIINMMRGTGWRGIATLRETDEIMRPLLGMRKRDVVSYAKEHGLGWREDVTNADDKYQRNYVRHNIVPRMSDQQFDTMMQLHTRQLEIREEIEREVTSLSLSLALNRYDFVMWSDDVAREMLRSRGGSLTRRELDRALLFIRTARPHKQLSLSNGRIIKTGVSQFIVSRREDC